MLIGYLALGCIGRVSILQDISGFTGVAIAVGETSRGVADTRAEWNGHLARFQVCGRKVTRGTQVAKRGTGVQIIIRDHDFAIRNIF